MDDMDIVFVIVENLECSNQDSTEEVLRSEYGYFLNEYAAELKVNELNNEYVEKFLPLDGADEETWEKLETRFGYVTLHLAK